MEKTSSVFALLTDLSKAIVSEHIPISDSSLPANKKFLYKKLRSKAYEIILNKAPIVYEDERRKMPDDEMEFINHPPSDMLVLSIPRYDKDPTIRQMKLQEIMEHLISSGLSENQTVQDMLELFLNLIDELPTDQIPVKPNKFGFINTDCFYQSKKPNKNGVIPYTMLPKELFDSRPLERTLTCEGLSHSDQKFRYNMFREEDFQPEPDFGAALSRMIRDSTTYTQTGIRLSTPSTGVVRPLQYIVCHKSCKLLNPPGWPEEQWPVDELSPAVPDGYWDGLYDTVCLRRTWEHPGDRCPPKYKRWLIDGRPDGSSICHDMLRLASKELHVVDRETFIEHLKYLLIGIASATFTLGKDGKTFSLRGDACITGLSPESTAVVAAAALACGPLALRLSEMSAPTADGGQMRAALCAFAHRFLLFHRAAVMAVDEDATPLEVSQTAQDLLPLLRCASRACQLDAAQPLLRGSRLLTRVYDHAMTAAAVAPREKHVLLSVLASCVSLYLRWLERWLFQGSCDAPSGEFFVEMRPEVSSDRSRVYWKKAFVLLKADAPGFLHGLERAVFDTGRGVDLLRLCNPRHPLLRVMSGPARPALRFISSASELEPTRAAFEAYYRAAAAAAGAPVSVEQLLEGSTEAEAVLQVHVQQVFEQRKRAHAVAQREAAAARAAGQAAQMEAWRTQVRLRSELREREAERERRLDEEIARVEAVARLREGEAVDARRKEMVSQYEAAFDAVKVRNRNLRDAIATESRLSAPPPPIPTEASPSEASLSTTPDSSDPQPSPIHEGLPSPNYEGLPSPNGNSGLIAALLQRQDIVDNNRLNLSLAADRQNQNAACDNLIVPEPTATAERKASLTLDLCNAAATANRNKVLGTDDALTKPWRTNDKMSPDEYGRLAAFGSRKASAERIRDRIAGGGERRPSSTTETQRAATANRDRVLGTDDALTKPWGDGSDAAAEEYRRLAALASRKASAERIRQRITGMSQPSERPRAPLTESGVELRVDGVAPESPMEISPAEDPMCGGGGYLREISTTSTALDGATPAAAAPDFLSARPALDRVYSYGPCSRYDAEWSQRLASDASSTAPRESRPAAAAEAEADDLQTVNHTLKRMIIVPIRTQMKLVNDAVLKHFLVDVELLGHLQSLRDYFFLLDGEFGRALTMQLYARLAAGGDHDELAYPAVLADVLDRALAAGGGDERRNGGRLALVASAAPARFRMSDPDALAFVEMRYEVGWPLNVLVTAEVVGRYQTVFAFLVKLRRCSWAMEELFLSLKELAVDREVSNSPQFKHVQLMRHVMAHMLLALHNYVTSTVLQESWMDLLHDLKAAATLDDIYYGHVMYLKAVLYRCLLGVQGKPEQFQRYLTNIFILVLKFHGQLTLGGVWTRDAGSGHYEHRRYADVANLYRLYQEQTSSLVRISKKLARGEYSHLYEMLQKLSMNDFYERKT